MIRKEIDRIDSEITRLLKERFMLAKRIGLLKKKNNLGIRDKKREGEVLRKTIRYAKSLGLNTQVAKEIFSIIIKEGRKTQKWRIQIAKGS